LIDQIDTQIHEVCEIHADCGRHLSNLTAAIYFSAYVYASHFILGVGMIVRRAI